MLNPRFSLTRSVIQTTLAQFIPDLGSQQFTDVSRYWELFRLVRGAQMRFRIKDLLISIYSVHDISADECGMTDCGSTDSVSTDCGSTDCGNTYFSRTPRAPRMLTFWRRA